VNAGTPQWNCQDAFPGSSAIIQFWEGSGGSFAQSHFKITSLTITKDVVLAGGGAYIDSTGTSGLVTGTSANVQIDGFTLTHTGTGAGRLIHNQGRLSIFNSVLTNGNVSALSGTSAASGNGGAIYNSGTGVIDYLAPDVSLSNNKAKLGGAIYNSTGQIADLRATIISNTATLAGGGIYNQCTSCNDSTTLKGRVDVYSAQIVGNTAISGGGVFNRGWFYMTDTYVILNSVSGSGSGESTPGGQSLDGSGGGVVSTPYSTTRAAIFNTAGISSVSSNTASLNGGGIYNAGQANLVGVSITDNRAQRGAALFSVPQGFFYYCSIGDATISYNVLNAPGTGRYSIHDGILLTNDDLRKCTFGNTTASSNTAPRYCLSSLVRPGSVCPQ